MSLENLFSPQESRISSILSSYAADNDFPYFRRGSSRSVILGEIHGKLREDHQVALIEALKPSALLVEDLGPYEILPGGSILLVQPGRRIGEFDRERVTGLAKAGVFKSLAEIARVQKIPLVGCDLSQGEMMRILFGEAGTDTFLRELEEKGRLKDLIWALDPDRQAHMEEMIRMYAAKGNSNPPLAIIGEAHGFNIQDQGRLTDYSMVLQTPRQEANINEYRSIRRLGSQIRLRIEQASSLEIKKKIALDPIS